MIQHTLEPKVGPLKGRRILILLENKYEDLELWYPKIRLIEAGAEVVIAAPEKTEYAGSHGLPATADVSFKEVVAEDYDGIIIPGGFAPDMLRRYKEVLDLVNYFHKSNKLVAFICHAGWVPISAGVLRGKRATGVVALKDDFTNAGAIWVDAPVVMDKNLISSRTPADLAYFCTAIVQFLQK